MFPLRLRSHYSLMRGTMSPAQICARAKSFGYKGVALTDSNNLYGLWPFLAACKRAKLRPIIGAELGDPESPERLTCLVRDRGGYENLCNLITLYKTGRNFNLRDCVTGCADGLLLLSQSVELLRALRDKGLSPVADLGPRPTQAGGRLKKWAESSGLAAVATPDCSVAEERDAELYFLLRAIAENRSVSEMRERLGREPMPGFEAPAVYRRRFAMWPEVVEKSWELAELCRFDTPYTGLVMPPWSGGDAVESLRQAAYRGARKRYGEALDAKVTARLEHELKVIEKMNFSSYFLVVRDIVQRPGKDGLRQIRRICGRGSGAASLVAYCLEITNVCPLKYNLYFERFLNPGRTDPPDIDIDFSWDERDEVLAEVLGDYAGHSAMVCNHVFFKPRMAVRETAKAYGLPGYEISRISKKISWLQRGEASLYRQLRTSPALRGADLSEPWPTLLRLAEKLVGIPRYLSVHPGGVIITPERISNYVPVEQAAKGVPLIQWEKDGAEEAGLVKIDLLGNRSLGVIRDCLARVRQRPESFREEAWTPEDDERTKNTVARGATMGCFYIESPAMRLLQQKAGNGDYEQLVIQSSIIRPAANEFVREYVRRLHGGEWQPLHPELADVLDETYGLMTYQEDVSRVAVHLAGFSHARADGLRKVMSKKDKEYRLVDYRQEFFDGCSARGLQDDKIQAIWKMMMSFSGYSFCKPHSASYARVSFQAAYLKTYFPAEFMAAVISNGGGYYSTFAYVSEAKRCGVKILPPDVNLSEKQWLGSDLTIRVGLRAIRGLSASLLERICGSRKRDGSFSSPADFLFRVRPAEDEARRLIHSGALDSLQKTANRSILLWELASFLRVQKASSQMPLFGVHLPQPPNLTPPSPQEMLRREYHALGFLCSRHPVTLFEGQAGSRVRSVELKKHVGRHIRFLGWLLTGKLVSTRTGEAMEFLSFEDDRGIVETTFFPKVYRRYAGILQTGKPYVLSGLVEMDYQTVTLTVERVDLVKKMR